MEKFFVFGKRAADALWEDEKDLDAVVEAINDLDAELFRFDPDINPIDDVLKAYSKWSDYSYLTPEQYKKISNQV